MTTGPRSVLCVNHRLGDLSASVRARIQREYPGASFLSIPSATVEQLESLAAHSVAAAVVVLHSGDKAQRAVTAKVSKGLLGGVLRRKLAVCWLAEGDTIRQITGIDQLNDRDRRSP